MLLNHRIDLAHEADGATSCNDASICQELCPTCNQACVGWMVERIDMLARGQQFQRQRLDFAARRSVGDEHDIGMVRTEPVARLRRRRTLPPHAGKKRRDQQQALRRQCTAQRRRRLLHPCCAPARR